MADVQTGYADDVLDLSDTGKVADTIVGADDLWKRNMAFARAVEGVDLIALNDAKRATLGGPLSVNEKFLASGVAGFIKAFEVSLKKLHLDTDHMKKAFEVDVCLEQAEASNNQVMAVTRSGVFVLAGEMTTTAGVVEVAAATAKAGGDERLSRRIDSAFGPLVTLRQDNLKSAAGVRTRTIALRSGHSAQLTAEQKLQADAITSKKMLTAPLPQVSPLPAKRTRKTKPKTGPKQGHAVAGRTRAKKAPGPPA